MKYLLIPIVLFFSFCTEKVQKTEVVISVEDMKEILKERQLLISTFNTYQYEGAVSEDLIDSMLSSTYINLGFSEEDFQSSWEYYLKDGNKELHEIFGYIIQDIDLMKEKSRE